VRTNHNSGLKTTRSRMANLLMALYDSGRTTFTTAEAAQITGLTLPLTSSLLHKARKRGLVSQLKRGLFVIVPPELGSSAEYAGNPYLVARYLADHAPYFLSHASAMELHRMVTQPQFVIFVSSTKRIPKQTLHGTQFRFVLLKSKVGSIYRRLGYLLDLFGIGTDAERQSLRTALTATYAPLDPSLPSEGSHTAKWRLQLNIPADELLAVRST
jgi:predicted transcriptional regulator of viral defense system